MINGKGFETKSNRDNSTQQSGLAAPQRESGNIPVSKKTDPMHRKPRKTSVVRGK